MVLNPFYLIFSIYLFSSFIELALGIFNGGFEIGSGFQVVSNQSYFVAFVAHLLFFNIVFFLYYIFLKSDFYNREFYIGNLLSWFVVVLQILYIIFFLSTGSRAANPESSYTGPAFLNYIFIVIDPDVIALCLLPFFRNKRIFLFGVSVFFLSFLLRGWMGGALIATLLFLIRFHPVKLARGTFLKTLIFVILLIASVPLLFAFKWGIREGQDWLAIFRLVQDKYSIEAVFVGVLHILDRFSNLNNVAFLVEHQDFFHTSFSLGDFRGFWLSGLAFEVICRVLGPCELPLNRFIVAEFYDPGATPWNVDPGLAGWIVVLQEYFVLIFLYVFFFFFIFSTLVFKFMGKASVNLFFVVFMVYAFHGWFGKFFNIMFFWVIFVLIYLFLRQHRDGFRGK